MFLDVLRWIASSSHTSFAVLGIQRFAQFEGREQREGSPEKQEDRRRNRSFAGEIGILHRMT
jgi:hypothetical protein